MITVLLYDPSEETQRAISKWFAVLKRIPYVTITDVSDCSHTFDEVWSYEFEEEYDSVMFILQFGGVVEQALTKEQEESLERFRKMWRRYQII